MAQITTRFDRVYVQSDGGERGPNVGARIKLKDHTCEAGVLGQFESGLCAAPGWGFPGGSLVKNLPANARHMDLIPVPGIPQVPQNTKPVWHNYRAYALEPGSHNY